MLDKKVERGGVQKSLFGRASLMDDP